MAIADVQTQVEEIAQAMVILDPADVKEMARIGAQFQELGAVFAAQDLSRAADIAAGAATAALEAASRAEVPAAVIATVNQALEILQEFLDQPASFDPAFGEPLAATASERPDGAGAPRPEGLTLSPFVDEAIVAEFLSRQSDAMPEIEKLILGFENGIDEDAVESLKRWFHTLKGESGLLGLSDVATVCHATEDMIQAESPTACVDRMLAVKDWLQACFDNLMDRGPLPSEPAEIMSLLVPSAALPAPEPVPASGPALAAEAGVLAAVAEVGEASRAADDPITALPAVTLPDYGRKNVQEGDVGLLQDFIAEAGEHLDASEAHLLTIEADPHASEALNAVFRAFHTIKGLAGFVELDHIQKLAHFAENLLDIARRGELVLRGLPMDLVFESVDMMKRLVEGVVTALAGSGYPEEVPTLPDLLVRLQAATCGVHGAAARRPAGDEGAAEAADPSDVVFEGDDEPAPAGKSGFVPLANLKSRQKASPKPAPVASPASRAAKTRVGGRHAVGG